MKTLAIVLAFAAASVAGVARAEIGTSDVVPAATLLLPYFEVDTQDPNGVNTLFTFNNASATAVVAHVTLWTDESVPTFTFDAYLTGYDSQAVNLGSLFVGGFLPVTADAGSDPTDTKSHKGPLSQDINFPGATGPCGNSSTIYTRPALTSIETRHLVRAHTGRSSPSLGGCAGANYGDNIARGYATVDVVNQCSTAKPSDAGYFSGGSAIATTQNVLWGDYTYVRGGRVSQEPNPMVHIEACNQFTVLVGNGAGYCPFAPGDYTFYARYTGDGSDQREPLPTTFAARYVNTGIFDNTDLVVWRDSKTGPVGVNGARACATDPDWFPLGQNDAVAFDEAENPTDLCAMGECFPLEAQRVPIKTGNPLGDPLSVTANAGWLYLNLNHTLAVNDPFPGFAQAWVVSYTSKAGVYSTGHPAVAMDNVLTTNPAGGFILFP